MTAVYHHQSGSLNPYACERYTEQAYHLHRIVLLFKISAPTVSERYKNEYTTIKYAYLMMKSVSLMEFSNDIQTLVTNYQKESYLIDSYYRWFYYAYDQIEDRRFSKYIAGVP